MGRFDNVFAGVLIGGQSRRMGRAKALLPHSCAPTFLEYVVSVARCVVHEVALLGSLEPLPAALRDMPRLPDAQPSRGPLAGLRSALEAAGDRWVLLLACDLARLGPNVLRRLVWHSEADVDVVAFARQGKCLGYHTCCALYHPRILPLVARELANGSGSLQAVVRSARVHTLASDTEASAQLANVNTPEDIGRLFTYTALPPQSGSLRDET